MTRTTSLEEVSDLFTSLRPAIIAFVQGDHVRAGPVRAHWTADGFCIGFPRHEHIPAPGTPVALLFDEGVFSFQLRGVRVIGELRPMAADDDDAADGLQWFKLEIGRTVAWDYGTMRRGR